MFCVFVGYTRKIHAKKGKHPPLSWHRPGIIISPTYIWWHGCSRLARCLANREFLSDFQVFGEGGITTTPKPTQIPTPTRSSCYVSTEFPSVWTPHVNGENHDVNGTGYTTVFTWLANRSRWLVVTTPRVTLELTKSYTYCDRKSHRLVQ
jgi:hypothetical protein